MATIGKVINTHGVHGELKIIPYSDYPERVKKLKRIYLEKNGNIAPYNVMEAFVNGRFWVIRVEGVRALTEAESLVDALVKIPGTERIPLPPGTYYLDQIIGLGVYTTEGEHIGEICDVLKPGSNDVYVVRRAGEKEKKPDLLLPALKSVVVRIDLEKERIEVMLPDGLL
jgi:16S rRNA processing protein RimM